MVSDLRQCQESMTPTPRVHKIQTPAATLSVGKGKWMRPILLIALAFVIIPAVTYFLATRSSKNYDAIAVLPISNMSGDPAKEYLADGLTENLINSLSVLPDVKLMSRSSVFRFKGKDIAAEDAGKELGVNAVLTGRLAQREQALSVSVELDGRTRP